ncbi:MAG: hypothetical protein AAFS10_19105, partial [Myxococcota bacterium]
ASTLRTGHRIPAIAPPPEEEEPTPPATASYAPAAATPHAPAEGSHRLAYEKRQDLLSALAESDADPSALGVSGRRQAAFRASTPPRQMPTHNSNSGGASRSPASLWGSPTTHGSSEEESADTGPGLAVPIAASSDIFGDGTRGSGSGVLAELDAAAQAAGSIAYGPSDPYGDPMWDPLAEPPPEDPFSDGPTIPLVGPLDQENMPASTGSAQGSSVDGLEWDEPATQQQVTSVQWEEEPPAYGGEMSVQWEDEVDDALPSASSSASTAYALPDSILTRSRRYESAQAPTDAAAAPHGEVKSGVVSPSASSQAGDDEAAILRSGGFETGTLERSAIPEASSELASDDLWQRDGFTDEELGAGLPQSRVGLTAIPEPTEEKGNAPHPTPARSPGEVVRPEFVSPAGPRGGLYREMGSHGRLDEDDVPTDFWASLPGAFTTPLSTGGLSWALTFTFLSIALLLSFCLPSIFGFVLSLTLRLVLIGSLTLYFQQAISCGISNDRDGLNAASAIQDFQSQWADLAGRGLMLIGLVCLLLAPAYFLSESLSSEPEGPTERTVSRSITSEEALFSETGALLSLDELSDPVTGYDNPDGEPPAMLIDPQEGTVTYVEVIPQEERGQRSPLMGLALLLCLAIPVVYIPMAFGLATFSSLAKAFNPIAVVHGIVLGGLPYMFVLGLGVASVGVMFVVSLILGAAATQDRLLSFVGVGVLMLPLIALYFVAVQGFLIGRLIVIRSED